MSVTAPPRPAPSSSSGRESTSGRAAAVATPLWAVLAFTFLNSIGGGVVTTGFSFLAESAYGFTASKNYWLGLAQGLTYIAGALGVGPVLAATMKRSGRVTPRLLLIGLAIALAALCVVPWAMRGLGGFGASASWPFWVLVTGYSALTGVLWPITESYMSGGRSGPRLRSAMGLFNVVWSSALVVAYVAMGPLLKHHALEVIVGVGAVHLASIVMVSAFTSRPAAHVHEEHGALPESYPRLLGVFRVQLPTSYLVYSALTPFLPLACKSLAIPKEWWTPLAAVWLATRVLTFAVLQRWHGWHGRWATAWVGSLLLLSGFSIAVLSTAAGPWGLGLNVGIGALVAGLGLFGIGMGTIYCSALYYAMSVGKAEVDAGGKHEALIGLGYGAGPICGLVAIAATNAGWLAADRPLGRVTSGQFQVLMLAVVAVIASGLVALSLVRAIRHASTPMEGRR